MNTFHPNIGNMVSGPSIIIIIIVNGDESRMILVNILGLMVYKELKYNCSGPVCD